MTTTQLVDGLGRARGSHYRAATDQLYLVEGDGKLSVLDLVRRLDTVVFEGAAIVAPDSSLRLTDDVTDQGGQVAWDHHSPSGELVMRPLGNCLLSYLGLVDYDSITPASLQGLSYSPDGLVGEGPGNRMVDGAVFAVVNTYPQPAADFDYAKVQVIASDKELKVRWETYRLHPAYRVLATEYEQPVDIAVTSDGHHAYVTEATGNLLRVDLPRPKRSLATVVTSALTEFRQLALDEPRRQVYFISAEELADSCHLVRVDLVTGEASVVTKGLDGAVGLVVTADGRTAYVSHRGRGRVPSPA